MFFPNMIYNSEDFNRVAWDLAQDKICHLCSLSSSSSATHKPLHVYVSYMHDLYASTKNTAGYICV